MPPPNESGRVFFTHFQKSQKITARKIITEEKLLRRTTGKVIPELNSELCVKCLKCTRRLKRKTLNDSSDSSLKRFKHQALKPILTFVRMTITGRLQE